jgi:hypothetical protein
MVSITLHLTEHEYTQLKRLADYTQVTPERLLKDVAHSMFPIILDQVPDWESLSDDEVLRLAQSLMSDSAMSRLQELRDIPSPTADERIEQAQLQAEYWSGQFIKTEAMIEARRRGVLT